MHRSMRPARGGRARDTCMRVHAAATSRPERACMQVILTAVGVTLVRLLGSWQPHRLPDDWLRASFRNPFKPPCGWAAWAAAGVCAAPLAAVAVSMVAYVLPAALTGGTGTVDAATGSGDGRVFAMLALTEGTRAAHGAAMAMCTHKHSKSDVRANMHAYTQSPARVRTPNHMGYINPRP